ncbi:MAG: M67 family peptidase [Chloroflexi bacterium]|nr:MAG: M67 family peptidase [Chloroflexota bacterium]
MLFIKRPIFNAIIAHAKTDYPLEACGLLAGTQNIAQAQYVVENIRRSPFAYEMDPLQQVRAFIDIEQKGWELLAIYHSHPKGPEFPSETDIEQAYYPETIYLIISLANYEMPVVRGYRINAGQITEVSIVVQ